MTQPAGHVPLVGNLTPDPSPARVVEMTPRRLAKLLVASSPSTARQGHGFVFQSGVSSLLGLYEPKSYTDEVDAYSITPPDDDVFRHSFKNIQEGKPVYLGSFERSSTLTRDFYLYVAFWRDFGENIASVHVLHVDAERWRGLFPADPSPFHAQSAFEGISNSREDDDAWALRQAELKSLWRRSLPEGSPMDINFKRDHKKQRRVQCSITPSGFVSLFAELFDEQKTLELERALGPRF